jgi:hypothetical protein
MYVCMCMLLFCFETNDMARWGNTTLTKGFVWPAITADSYALDNSSYGYQLSYLLYIYFYYYYFLNQNWYGNAASAGGYMTNARI